MADRTNGSRLEGPWKTFSGPDRPKRNLIFHAIRKPLQNGLFGHPINTGLNTDARNV
jgi:hypothetical protein